MAISRSSRFSRICDAFAASELTQISDHKTANHIWTPRCSARANRVNLCSKNKFQLVQCFGGRFAREFLKVMHHVHLIVVPEFMCDIGPRFR
jgi:hypothetical protein